MKFATRGTMDAEWLYTCSHCGGLIFELLTCLCGTEFYCSKYCQRLHWKDQHKHLHGSLHPELPKSELALERRIWRKLRDDMHLPGAPTSLFDVITPDAKHYQVPWREAARLTGKDPQKAGFDNLSPTSPLRVVGIIHLIKGVCKYRLRHLFITPDLQRLREEDTEQSARYQTISGDGSPFTKEHEAFVHKKALRRRARRAAAVAAAAEAAAKAKSASELADSRKKKKKKKKKTKRKASE